MFTYMYLRISKSHSQSFSSFMLELRTSGLFVLYIISFGSLCLSYAAISVVHTYVQHVHVHVVCSNRGPQNGSAFTGVW